MAPAPPVDPEQTKTLVPLPAEGATPLDGGAARDDETPVGASTAKEFAANVVAEDSGPAGEPLPLAHVLQQAGTRRRQIDATHAYWRLVWAVGKHSLCLEETEFLEALAAADDLPMVLAARAAGAARLQQARCAVVAAQHELADLVGLAPGEPLPLPADPPFTGPYRTDYDLLAARGASRPQLALLDQTLPLRHNAIEFRTRAVDLGRRAMGPLANAYRRGEVGVESVISAFHQWRDQRHALLESICTYNDDIADYALNAVGETVTGQRLLATLIETERSGVRPAAAVLPEGDLTGAVKQAGGAESPTSPSAPAGIGRQSPTPAGPEAKSPTGPTPAPPAEEPKPAAPPPGSTEPAPPEEVEPTAETPPAAKEPASSEPGQTPRPGEGLPPAGPKRPVVPVQPTPAPRLSFKFPEGGAPPSLDRPTGQYPGLVAASPAVRAKQLTLWLHRHDADGTNDGEGTPIELKAALEAVTGARRVGVIAAYWRAREADARLRSARQQTAWLDDLEPPVDSPQGGPLNEASRLLLGRARDGARADVLEAEAARLAARTELAGYLGGSVDAASLTAVTPPHWGGYRLKLEALPAEMSARRSVRRLADVIPARGEAIKALATAVVEADVARAEASAAFQVDDAPLARVLQRIDEQKAQTEAFLSTLTDYNIALAEYALAVLPPQTPSSTLAGALVIGGG